jgi:pimeloyl-ACP methyl ester carboxylesterase
VPEDAPVDLRRRIEATRWPDALTGTGWSYGIDPGFLRHLCGYWAESYDWRRHEAVLNALGSFRSEIDGANVHFLHLRSPEPNALPIVLTHGWPGSVVEFTKVMAPLADPVGHGGDAADAFHVVCPSIPGFGFSGPTAESGWHTRRVADAVATLMQRLGYDRYIAQGGDWGSTISTWLACLYPRRVLGLHLNTVALHPDQGTATPDLTEAERGALARLHRYLSDGAGYGAIQSTRPNTVGLALDDSPAGLCGWIVEKFGEWSDGGEDPLNCFSADDLLTNVSVYWFTRTAASSARLYRETAQAGTGTYQCPRVEVPTGCAIYPAEIATPSRRWADPRYNVVYWNEQPSGGHFAAYEVPELFVDDVRGFARLVR